MTRSPVELVPSEVMETPPPPSSADPPAAVARRLIASVDAIARALEAGGEVSAAVAQALAERGASELIASHESRSPRAVTLRLADGLTLRSHEIRAEAARPPLGAVHDQLLLTSPSNVPPEAWDDLPESEVLRTPWGTLSIGYTHGSDRVRSVGLTLNSPRPPAPPPLRDGEHRAFSEVLKGVERATAPIWADLETSLRRDLGVRNVEPWELEALPVPLPVAWPPDGGGRLWVEVAAREGPRGRRVEPFAGALIEARTGWLARVEPVVRRLRWLDGPVSDSGADWSAAVQHVRAATLGAAMPAGGEADEILRGYRAFRAAFGPLADPFMARHRAFSLWLGGAPPDELPPDETPVAGPAAALAIEHLERKALAALQPMWRQFDPSLYFREPAVDSPTWRLRPPLKAVDGWTLGVAPMPFPVSWPPQGDGLLDFVALASRSAPGFTSEATQPFARATVDARAGRLVRIEAFDCARSPAVAPLGALTLSWKKELPSPGVLAALVRAAVERGELPQGDDAEALQLAYRCVFDWNSQLASMEALSPLFVAWVGR